MTHVRIMYSLHKQNIREIVTNQQFLCQMSIEDCGCGEFFSLGGPVEFIVSTIITVTLFTRVKVQKTKSTQNKLF